MISQIPTRLFSSGFSSTALSLVQPYHSRPPVLFPEVLGSLCCCIITAHALTSLFLSFPSPSVSAAHHASLCPPNAPLSLPQSTLGRGPWGVTKGWSAGPALRTLVLSWKVKRSPSFMAIRRALCWRWTVAMLNWGSGQMLYHAPVQDGLILYISPRQDHVAEGLAQPITRVQVQHCGCTVAVFP